VGTSSLPLAIIGGLLYAAFFVKAEPEIGTLKARPLERRDAFYGVAAPEGSILWAAGSYGKIVRSEDGGLTWGVQGSPVITHLQSIAAWDARRAVAVGNRGLVEITDDAGKTWQEVTVPRSEWPTSCFRCGPIRTVRPGPWASGRRAEDRRLRHHLDPRAAEKDQAWNDVFFIGQNGLAGGRVRPDPAHDGWRSSWIAVPSPVKNSLMSVHFRDAQHGVAVGLAGTVLVSADGGASWQEAPP
jgi:photosystem II stability/assembly factor-like uncharacterized protein